MTLILNSNTQQRFEHYTHFLPQSLLIIGERGMGAATLARTVAHTHSPHPYVVQPQPTTKTSSTLSISIDQIRDVLMTARSAAQSTRIILIEDMHMMTTQAQNAFLKLLEEPPRNTHFILTAHSDAPILLTITSRTQLWHLTKLGADDMQRLSRQYPIDDQTARTQALFIANGKPAEYVRIANDPQRIMTLTPFIHDAKLLLQGEIYQKITTIARYKENRQDALLVTEYMLRLLRMSLQGAKESETHRKKLEHILRAYERLRANGNVRLVLLDIVL